MQSDVKRVFWGIKSFGKSGSSQTQATKLNKLPQHGQIKFEYNFYYYYENSSDKLGSCEFLKLFVDSN